MLAEREGWGFITVVDDNEVAPLEIYARSEEAPNSAQVQYEVPHDSRLKAHSLSVDHIVSIYENYG